MDEKQELVIRALFYLEEYLQGTLSLQTVAQLMQYSLRYLYRNFTQPCGMRMHDCMKRRRISKAARCSCETDTPVLGIAASYGYEGSQAFSQAFKRLYKMICIQSRRGQRYYALQHPLQLHELSQTESVIQELQIRQAVPRDMDTRMQLMRQAVGLLPYSEETVYERQLLKCMKQKGTFLVPLEKTAFVVIQLQLKNGQIDALAIRPQLHCLDAVKRLIEWMQYTCTPCIDLVTTCFHATDRADTGYRRLLLEAGSIRGRELVEFGYPVQRLYYRRTQDA